MAKKVKKIFLEYLRKFDAFFVYFVQQLSFSAQVALKLPIYLAKISFFLFLLQFIHNYVVQYVL